MAIAQSAVAADMPVKATPAAVVAANWNGFYIGIDGGWSRASWDHHFLTDGHYNTAPGQEFDYHKSGGMAGVHAGYNVTFSNVLLGIEGGWAHTWLKSGTLVSPFFPDSDRWNSDVDWIATAVGRIGVTAGNSLFYLKGGGAWARIRDHVHDDNDFVDANRTVGGWTAGVGAEHMLTPNWIIGFEYDYYQFKNNINLPDISFTTGLPGSSSTDHDLRTKIHAALVRLSYKMP